MRFEFRGFDQEGNFKSGIISAKDRDTAISVLQNQGILVTYIKPISEIKPLLILGGVSYLDLAFFCRALKFLLKSGVSLDESLKALAQQVSKPQFRRIIEEIYESVLAGLPFSQALEKFSDIFEKTMVRLIRIGEISGNLEEILDNLANHYENQNKLRNKIIGAMIYPALVLLIFLVTMFVLFTQVIPKIAGIFEENNLELPTFTKYMALVSNFLLNYGIYVLLFVIFLIYVLIQYLKTEEGKLFIYNLLASFPLFGPLLQEINNLSILESLTFLIKGGLPIAESLKIVSESMTNPYYKNALEFIAEETSKGKSIGDSIKNFPDLFTPLVIQAFYTGEKTGNLYNVLNIIKEHLSTNIEFKISNISEYIQPFIIIILAIGLVVLELSLILPIQQLSRAFSTI